MFGAVGHLKSLKIHFIFSHKFGKIYVVNTFSKWQAWQHKQACGKA